MENPIRVIFLILNRNAPSSRFRVLQNISFLKSLHIDATVKVIPKQIYSRLKLFRELPRYDLVFLQKRLFQRWQVWYLRQKARRLVFDFDDAIMYRDSGAQRFDSWSRRHLFARIAGKSDAVFCGNEYLKELTMPFTRKVFVIPTGVDTGFYIPKTGQTASAPLTLGWIGSRPSLVHLQHLVKPINELYAETHAFRLKIVCDDFIEGFHCPVEKKVWTASGEVADIQSFDIGIMPLSDNKWARGKCALKLLQYMSCALPSVSTRTQVTESVITDGVDGHLAVDDRSWYEKLKALLPDSDQRQKMGAHARRKAIKTYDTRAIAACYAAHFKTLCRDVESPSPIVTPS